MRAPVAEGARESQRSSMAADPLASIWLVARLNDLQHRIQYLQNVLARTRADLSVAQAQLDAPAMLITVLTAPATLPARSGGSQDRVSALMAAIAAQRA